MAEHNKLGKEGEDAAVKYLESHGYVIRHRNWRRGHLELDIVAAKDNTLVIVEVKTRTDDDHQAPQDAVDGLKISRIVRATDAYIKQFGIEQADLRFDIIAITTANGTFKIEHIEEAFYPPII